MHHGAGLRELLSKKGVAALDADALIEALAKDHTHASLEPRTRAILDYALKLTLTPGEMTGADVECLRAEGLDDRAVHDVCLVVAYFAFVNRIADGLGVELEPRFSGR